MSAIPSPVMPAVGEPKHSTGKARIWNRLAGFGLTLIALGPILVIAAAMALTMFAVVGLVRHTSAGIATVAAIVDREISPQITKIESTFDDLAVPLSQLRTNVNGAMTSFDHLGSVQIARGAWGSAPSVHIKVPPSDLHLGEVTVEVPHVGLDGVRMERVSKPLATIDDGALFNQATPSVPIPPTPITLSMEPVQRALSPFGPNGAIGKAIKAVENGVDKAIADLGGLRRPILAVRDGIAGLLAPVEKVIAPVLSALFVVLVALVAQVLLSAAGILFLIRSRPTEFANALVTRGPFGLLGYCYRALLQYGFYLSSGRRQAQPERQIDDLRAQTELLQSEIAALRADLLSPGAGAAAR